LLDALLETPLALAPDGTVSPPALPGVGVRFATEVLEPHRVR
jgi:L-alanine-DL-glutamate epimerase-like enolase superfamily enzyme